MSKVDNTDPVERKVHIEFHCLAVKYDVNVDKIGMIIQDWIKWEERNFIRYTEEVNPKKPPLLSDDELDISYDGWEDFKAVAKAQRKLDIKFYTDK